MPIPRMTPEEIEAKEAEELMSQVQGLLQQGVKMLMTALKTKEIDELCDAQGQMLFRYFHSLQKAGFTAEQSLKIVANGEMPFKLN